MGYYDLKALKRPKGTTHAKLVTEEGKKALVPIKDFGVLQGTCGDVTFLKQNRKGKYEEMGKMYFDGVWPIKVEDEESVLN